jgi:hypothetical protein
MYVKQKKLTGGKIMSKPAFVTFQIHQEKFSFLGIENIVIESTDYVYIWDKFLGMG